jgi:hypothetical protein
MWRSAECGIEVFITQLKNKAKSEELIPYLLNDSKSLIHRIKLVVSSIVKETAMELRVRETTMQQIETMTHIFQIILSYIHRRKGSACILSNPAGQIHWIQLELAITNVCKEFMDAKIRLHTNYHAPFERAEKLLESVLESENVSHV